MFGILEFIQKTYATLQTTTNPTPEVLRQLDGMIGLSVLGEQTSDQAYGAENYDAPYALIVSKPRSLSAKHLQKDVIEFVNLGGKGWIIMSESKVVHYTTSFDAAMSLIADARWSISDTGLVKLSFQGQTIREKLATPLLSLCAAGLLVQTRLRLETK